MSTSNFKEGQIVLIDLKGAAGFHVDDCLGEVINVGQDGMIVLALGTVKNDTRPVFIVHPSKLSKPQHN